MSVVYEHRVGSKSHYGWAIETGEQSEHRAVQCNVNSTVELNLEQMAQPDYKGGTCNMFLSLAF